MGCGIPTGQARGLKAHGGAEAERSGRKISRIVVAFEAGRDGFWLGRWLRTRGIEAHVIHATSVAVSREHRRAKTDRIDGEQLLRTLMAYCRGEPRVVRIVRVPSVEQEDVRRATRERDRLIKEQTAHSNRIKGLLRLLGMAVGNPRRRDWLKWLAAQSCPQFFGSPHD